MLIEIVGRWYNTAGCEDAEKMFKDVGEAYGTWETAVIAC